MCSAFPVSALESKSQAHSFHSPVPAPQEQAMKGLQSCGHLRRVGRRPWHGNPSEGEEQISGWSRTPVGHRLSVATDGQALNQLSSGNSLMASAIVVST